MVIPVMVGEAAPRSVTCSVPAAPGAMFRLPLTMVMALGRVLQLRGLHSVQVARTFAATNTPRRVDSARVHPKQMVLLAVLPQDNNKKRTNVWTTNRTTAINALEFQSL